MSSQEDEDLEDGEIASDDEEVPDESKTEKAEEKSTKEFRLTPDTPKKPNEKITDLPNDDNDFVKDLQKLKEDVERKKIRKDARKRRELERDVGKRRKRRMSDDSKTRREKRKKPDSGLKGTGGKSEGEDEDVNEDEMLGLCIRGASPTIDLDQVEVWSGKQPITDPNWQFNENSENDSEFEDRDDRKRRRKDKDRRNFKATMREDREIKKRLQMKRKGKNRKDMDNSEMICINFMKGNCNKGNDCFYSHAVCPPKKMELCKFYLMDCCAKRDKCLYLHEEFPCKFFHTGLKCYAGKKCKFSHDPLNSLSKDILLKHLETAPKELLGDFPRLSRDCAETMVNSKTTGKPSDGSKIPSLFDIQVSIPPQFQSTGEKNEERTTPPCSPPPNVKTSPKTKSKEGTKLYKDSESNENETGTPIDFARELEAYKIRQMENKNTETKSLSSFIDQDERWPGAYEKEERWPGAYEKEERWPGAYEKEERWPGAFDKEEKWPGAFDKEEKWPGALDKEEKWPGALDKEEKWPGAFDKEEKWPGSFDKEEKWPGAFDKEEKWPGAFDNEEKWPGAFDKEEKWPGAFDKEEKWPGALDKEEKWPGALDKEEKWPGALDKEEKWPGAFDKEEKWPGAIDKEDRWPGALGKEEKWPGAIDKKERWPGAYGKEERWPGAFDEDTENQKEVKRRKRKREDRRDKKNKRKGEDEECRSSEEKKSRKDRNSSKRSSGRTDKSKNYPVRLTEDGTFGGIKFKIINRKEIRKSSDSEKDLLLPMKIEKPNEFLSSDDEKPLNYFVKKEKKQVMESKGSDDGEKFGVEIKPDVDDETDENEPENPLIIETNDDQDEEEKTEELAVPKHLPKKQQELFMRIRAQNRKIKEEKRRRKESSKERKSSAGSESGSEAEVGKTPSPEPADENWYSSDDEENFRKENPLKTVFHNLSMQKNLALPESTSKVSVHSLSQAHTLAATKPKIEIPALNGPDLSKINITELLSSIRQVTNKKSQGSPDTTLKPSVVPPSTSYELSKIENPIKINYFNSEPEKKEIKDPRLRDPRVNHEQNKKTLEEKSAPGKTIYDNGSFKMEFQDSDLRLRPKKFDSDDLAKSLDSIVPFGDVDLRNIGSPGDRSDIDFDLRKFGLPFKPVPVHSAATEIDASLNSHPPINYKVEAILIPRPDFSSIKVSPTDPQVKRDPRLRRLFRINSFEGEPKEEQQKKQGLPSDPRQRKPPVADTPKSPTESPFSPKQNEPVLGNPNLLNANLLLLAQLGLSAAAAGTNVFDPRIQQLLKKTPQELELLRSQLTNVKTQPEFELFRGQPLVGDGSDAMRSQGQGLLPTPVGAAAGGMGLLGPAPAFMMPGLTMPDASVLMGPMGGIPQGPVAFDPRFAGVPNDVDDGNDGDNRHFNRGFRNDRRGRGSWRGNRDRNWDRDNRRHNKRDDRNRHNRDRDDRREKRRSNTPD